MEAKRLHPDDLNYLVDSFNEIFCVFSAIEYNDLEHLHTDYCKVWYGGTHKWACEELRKDPTKTWLGHFDSKLGKCKFYGDELILN
jgi:hypothetical protein